MDKSIEPPSNTGFTPLIEQQESFESFKSSKPFKIHSQKQGTFSILKFDNSSTLPASSSNYTPGLLSVAAADIVLERVQYATINTEIWGAAEKSSTSEVIEEQQKRVVYHTVDYIQKKKLRSTVKNITTFDREFHMVPTEKQLCKPVPKKYLPRNSPPKSFHKFGRLPIELRFKIWGYAIPIDRVVGFTVRGEDRKIFKPRNTSIPIVLHACRESRQIALKALKPMFHTLAKADCYIYFDVNTDVLKLRLKCAQRLAITRDHNADKDRRLVEHLEIPCHINPKDPFMGDAIATLILRGPYRSWGSLKTLFLSGREGKSKKHLIHLRVTLPDDVKGANKKIGPFGKNIQKQLKKALEERGRRVNIAIMVKYD